MKQRKGVPGGLVCDYLKAAECSVLAATQSAARPCLAGVQPLMAR